ncbi:MAG: helix-turn-helix domain-containing protein [Solirubrobacteraceae bacterium]
MVTPAPAPTGPALREARRDARLSIDQLAVAAGVSSATVERIEHERVSRPHRATLAALGFALATAVAENHETSIGRGANAADAKTAAAGDGHGAE